MRAIGVTTTYKNCTFAGARTGAVSAQIREKVIIRSARNCTLVDRLLWVRGELASPINFQGLTRGKKGSPNEGEEAGPAAASSMGGLTSRPVRATRPLQLVFWRAGPQALSFDFSACTQ